MGLSVHLFIHTSPFHGFLSNRWGEWSQIWWIHIMVCPRSEKLDVALCWYSTVSWPYSIRSGNGRISISYWLTKAVSVYFHKKTANRMELKFGLQTHWEAHQAWLTFGHAVLYFPRFLALSGRAVSVHLQTKQIELKFGAPTHYGPLQAWLTFGHAPLNFCFLASWVV